MKNILVAVTGASPQVLTETLFGLHIQGKALPEEVFVITTKNSKQMLVDGLFEQGHWQRLITDYSLPQIKFDESNIWVISDEQGNELEDAKGEEDQSTMADFITRKVAMLTADTSCAIHASIAGGRKTMAFYMGYAMSLYGREQDALSHVFVNDEFEFVRDFYYPTLQEHWIDGKTAGSRVNTKDAHVTLAEIPFVRMRKQFESDLLNQLEDSSFSKTVALMNAASQPLAVSISLKSRTLSVLGIDIKLSAKLLALYLFMLSQPQRKIKVGSGFIKNTDFTKQYLQFFYDMKGDVRVYGTFGLEDEGDWVRGQFDNLQPLNAKFIQEVLSQLHKKLIQLLPNDVVDHIKVHSDGVKGGSTYSVSETLTVDVIHPCDL
ncbi:CRISPR-associated ring nuclease Csm6 [Shewanella gelidimarina]|uniref:CRISPR-associated ring nuclease Csm6 n=1 Tax=Shewanella gelidimarina TaxID=56813 RepID=UPI00200C7C47|nr:CRISPR-associated ring nuclease Csm6 [Shewanella gelidimarina]MCL1058668.1 CRISPR-associated ring nuclease Csm6 [Shewanella gelidimarina]